MRLQRKGRTGGHRQYLSPPYFHSSSSPAETSASTSTTTLILSAPSTLCSRTVLGWRVDDEQFMAYSSDFSVPRQSCTNLSPPIAMTLAGKFATVWRYEGSSSRASKGSVSTSAVPLVTSPHEYFPPHFGQTRSATANNPEPWMGDGCTATRAANECVSGGVAHHGSVLRAQDSILMLLLLSLPLSLPLSLLLPLFVSENSNSKCSEFRLGSA